MFKQQIAAARRNLVVVVAVVRFVSEEEQALAAKSRQCAFDDNGTDVAPGLRPALAGEDGERAQVRPFADVCGLSEFDSARQDVAIDVVAATNRRLQPLGELMRKQGLSRSVKFDAHVA